MLVQDGHAASTIVTAAKPSENAVAAVRELQLYVRKMSGAVAARLGLRDRGLLRKGFFADVVIFDAATVSDKATFEDSHQISQGIRDVWVNGKRVLKDSEHTGATPGRIVGR